MLPRQIHPIINLKLKIMSKVFFSACFLAIGILFIQCKKDKAFDPETSIEPHLKTDTFTLVNNDWKIDGSYVFDHLTNGYMWANTRYHERNFAPISQDILDNGIVLCYFTPSLTFNTNNWTPLNFSLLSHTQDFYYNLACETSVGKFKLHYFYSANANGVTVPNVRTAIVPKYKFKIVALTGAHLNSKSQTSASNKLSLKGQDYTKEQLQNMSYAQVAKLLDL